MVWFGLVCYSACHITTKFIPLQHCLAPLNKANTYDDHPQIIPKKVNTQQSTLKLMILSS